MRTSYVNILTITFLGLLGVSGCGDRPAPGSSSDAGVVDVARRPDQGRPGDHDLWLGDLPAPSPDACVMPPGACTSTRGCPSGFVCVGCEPDPCCPMCDHCVGRCQKGCSTNENCGPDEYCHVDGACQTTGAKWGECRARPQGATCNATEPPVCGCNGKLYACTEVAHAAGVNLAPDPLSCWSCDRLAKQYAQTLLMAKQCSVSGPPAQCTQTVDSALACGCPTRVNAASGHLATLTALKKTWTAKQCGTAIDCPPVACEAIVGASCSPSLPPASSGHCTDLFTH